MENFMAGEIQAAFNTVYSDGPSTQPDEPSKARIRNELAPVIQAQVDDGISIANDALQVASSGTRPVKTPIRAASVSNVTLASVVNGASFGGVTIATGDRVGFLGQTSAAENGVYVVQASAPPVRAVDLDTGDEFPYASFYINEGTLAGQTYTCVTPAPITVGTTLLTFRKTADVSSLVPEIAETSARVTDLENTKTTMRRVVEILIDGWTSAEICLVGDSITWGVGATGTATETPRTGELTDPRNNLTSPSWANLFRDYLIANFCSGTLVNPSPGVGYARRWFEFDPTTDAKIRFISRSSGLDITPKPVASNGNASFRRLLDLPANNSDRAIEFTFYGDEAEFVFAGTATDPGATFTVEVDGAVVGSYSHYRNPAAFRQTQAITAAFGQHTVRIWNNSNTQALRCEMVRHNRRLQVRNQGIIGVQSARWLPTDTLWPGIAATDNIVLCQLGTNDRIGFSGFSLRPQKLRDNLNTIVTQLKADGKVVVLATPPKAAPTSDYPIVGNPTYYFDTADAAQSVRLAAEDMKVSVIDHFQNFAIDYASLLADGIHPDDDGHYVEHKAGWVAAVQREQAAIALAAMTA
ncbi:GDSL-type esterase/lipase family protein [Sinorhizobium meliloti]|uniref:SGNH/GDSL hydrolase family protein n=1 Tax=Rhizobium meliloti TaxID=382 RepID=UPI00244E4394|nr:GDSL-type esterase/lipase family protein [Sinorhizobium meliloti]WGI75376.1 GDSL-type esterase/lipase family protein [Sinorhizobium meliloti]